MHCRDCQQSRPRAERCRTSGATRRRDGSPFPWARWHNTPSQGKRAAGMLSSLLRPGWQIPPRAPALTKEWKTQHKAQKIPPCSSVQLALDLCLKEKWAPGWFGINDKNEEIKFVQLPTFSKGNYAFPTKANASSTGIISLFIVLFAQIKHLLRSAIRRIFNIQALHYGE